MYRWHHVSPSDWLSNLFEEMRGVFEATTRMCVLEIRNGAPFSLYIGVLLPCSSLLHLFREERVCRREEICRGRVSANPSSPSFESSLFCKFSSFLFLFVPAFLFLLGFPAPFPSLEFHTSLSQFL
eukprot:TRINITY_DN24554_c0_g1_i2.p2 TRINITY_DN24554_c0_g1~~TRINITY_DN24554_c0_g1_i2.p2  ORF type:complete len:126 (-),score=5.52 TRINITY_DN24554_c0_g1_i2:469-846(-)